MASDKNPSTGTAVDGASVIGDKLGASVIEGKLGASVMDDKLGAKVLN